MNEYLQNVLKIIVCILALASIVGNLAYLGRQHPIWECYMLSNIAGVLAFLIAYRETKDWFWLFSALSFALMLCSDAYFIPSTQIIWPHEAGGMNIWAGISQLPLAIGLFFYFKKISYKWLIPITFIVMILMNFSFSGLGQLRHGNTIGQMTGLFWFVTQCSFLAYYGYIHDRIGYSLGAAIRLLSLIAVSYYFFTVAHDYSPFTLAWSDKTISISRDIMAIGALIKIKNKFLR